MNIVDSDYKEKMLCVKVTSKNCSNRIQTKKQTIYDCII